MTFETRESSLKTYLRPLPLTVTHVLSSSSCNTTNMDRAEMSLQRIRLKVTVQAESALLIETGSEKESRSIGHRVEEEEPCVVVPRDVTLHPTTARTFMLEEDFTRFTLQVCKEKSELSWSSRYRLLAFLSLYKFKKLSHVMV